MRMKVIFWAMAAVISLSWCLTAQAGVDWQPGRYAYVTNEKVRGQASKMLISNCHLGIQRYNDISLFISKTVKTNNQQRQGI